MNYVVNPGRAQEVVAVLAHAFEGGVGILADKRDLVENQVPPGVEAGSAAHAAFMFFLVANDHGVRSRDLYQRAKVLYSEDPTLFSAAHVLARYAGPEDPTLIQRTGARLATRYPRQTARSWYLNSQQLREEYSADPRELFSATDEAAALLGRICAFRSYGPKTGGMLLRAAVGVGLAQVRGLEVVLLPVDIHDARISFQTGIVSVPGQQPSEALYRNSVPVVQHVLRQACRDADTPWLNVDRALWLVGSRGCAYKRCAECPLQRMCSVGRQRLAQRTSSNATADECRSHPLQLQR